MSESIKNRLDSMLTKALSYHQRGRLAQADALYNDILRAVPGHAEVLHLKGVLSHQCGRNKEAAKFLDKALKKQPNRPQFLFHRGIVFTALGRLREAESVYRRALKAMPDYPEALNNLGTVLKSLGQVKEAEVRFRKALAVNPSFSSASLNLGNLLIQLDRPQEAESCYRRALEIDSGSPASHNCLGIALQALGRLDEAEASYRRAIAIDPRFAEAHYSLGNLYRDQERPAESITCYRQALELRENYPEALSSLGNVLRKQGQAEEAVACHQRATALKPDSAEVYNSLGNSQQAAGFLADAEQSFRRAIKLKPGLSEAHNNLGNVLHALGRCKQAESSYRLALEKNPQFADAYNNLATVLHETGSLQEALQSVQQALSLQPDSADAYNNRGRTLQSMGRWEEAEESYRQALSLRPEYTEAHSNLLYALSARCRLSPQQVLEEYIAWDRIHGQAGNANRYAHTKPRDGRHRLRIGYVSPDLRHHVVAQFFEPLLGAHDREQVEVWCYAQVGIPDQVTERLRGLADGWCFTAGMSDQALARRIRDDGIDILVDLAGHTAGNRLPAFAWKPAPVQMTWLGYFAGTGLSAMDYWITDANLHPADTVESSVEEIVRLPRCWVCYRPDTVLPAVVSKNRHEGVVFGCFNNNSKLTPETLDCWTEILLRHENSRLLLMAREFADASVRDTLTASFTSQGVDAGRLELRAGGTIEEYLASHGEVDVVLDPFPRTGGTTTADALWMGVPVVTLAGQRYAERISAATLMGIGAAEWIASGRDDYVRIALSLAERGLRGDRERASLREQISLSPLMNAEGLARAMEKIYSECWRRYIED